MSEWREVAVADIAASAPNALSTGPFGSAISSKYFQASGVPVLRGSNLSEDVGQRLSDAGLVFVSRDKANEFSRSVVRRGDLVFTCWGTIGQVGLIDFRAAYDEYVVSNKQMKLSPDPNKADSLFLYYAFSSAPVVDDIKAQAIGSSVPGFNLGQLRQLRLRLPPLPSQRAIAHILGSLDDKIELNRRTNETLEAMARALFQSWFVDFDPVRAKAAGRAPSGMDAETAKLFPKEFVASEMGEIPKGWRVGRFGDIAGFLAGYAFKSRDWMDQGIPVVKIGSVRPGIVDLNAVSYVSVEVANDAARYRLRPGDLLIGMTGYVGEVGLVPETSNPPLLNQRVGKIVLDSPGTTRLAFAYCLTRRTEFKAEVESQSHGTAQANVSAEGILSVPIIVPPQPLRIRFDQSCQSILQRILHMHAESQTLASLRDALLPRLLSGELSVKQAEAVVARRT